MDILFGEVTGDYLKSCLEDDSKLFENHGKYFDFVLEIKDDTFTIRDTLGRYVPIGAGEFEGLYRAVKTARKAAKAIANYEEVSDLIADTHTIALCV